MSKSLFLAAMFIFACSHPEPTGDASVPARTAQLTAAPSASAGPVGASVSAVPPPKAAEVGSAALTVPRGARRSTMAVGYTSGLRLESGLATYCDDRRGRALDLATGIDSAYERPCPKDEERNRACDGIAFIEQVREPGLDDIIDTNDGPSIPVNGHIHDCVFNAGVLLVATGLEVVAFDVKADHRKVKSKEGGDQVAISDGWLAWSEGRKVVAERR